MILRFQGLLDADTHGNPQRPKIGDRDVLEEVTDEFGFDETKGVTVVLGNDWFKDVDLDADTGSSGYSEWTPGAESKLFAGDLDVLERLDDLDGQVVTLVVADEPLPTDDTAVKVRRTFARIDPGNIDGWGVRMDGLLVADPTELYELISDAIIALVASAPRGGTIGRADPEVALEMALDVVRVSLENIEPIVEVARRRLRDVMSALGEHLPEIETQHRLWEMARVAPWE